MMAILTLQEVEWVHDEQRLGRERKAEAKFDEALAHFRTAAAFYENADEKSGQGHDEHADILYDATETMISLGKYGEASLTLRRAWMISGDTKRLRAREIAAEVLKTGCLGSARPPLRAAAVYVLGSLDLSPALAAYSSHGSPLAYWTESSNESSTAGSSRGVNPWLIVQLIFFVIVLLIKLSSC